MEGWGEGTPRDSDFSGPEPRTRSPTASVQSPLCSPSSPYSPSRRAVAALRRCDVSGGESHNSPGRVNCHRPLNDDDADIDGSLGAIEPLSNNDWLTLTSETLRNLTSGYLIGTARHHLGRWTNDPAKATTWLQEAILARCEDDAAASFRAQHDTMEEALNLETMAIWKQGDDASRISDFPTFQIEDAKDPNCKWKATMKQTCPKCGRSFGGDHIEAHKMTCGHSLSRRRRPDRAALYPTLATLDGLPALTDSIVGDDLQRDGFSESSEPEQPPAALPSNIFQRPQPLAERLSQCRGGRRDGLLSPAKLSRDVRNEVLKWTKMLPRTPGGILPGYMETVQRSRSADPVHRSRSAELLPQRKASAGSERQFQRQDLQIQKQKFRTGRDEELQTLLASQRRALESTLVQQQQPPQQQPKQRLRQQQRSESLSRGQPEERRHGLGRITLNTMHTTIQRTHAGNVGKGSHESCSHGSSIISNYAARSTGFDDRSLGAWVKQNAVIQQDAGIRLQERVLRSDNRRPPSSGMHRIQRSNLLGRIRQTGSLPSSHSFLGS